jgi:hypothetical protein
VSLRKQLLIGLVSLAGTSAFGADSGTNAGSEMLHQTAAGKWEVTPDIEYHNYTIKMNDQAANGKLTGTGFTESVKGEYGINEMFSVGLKLAITNDSWKLTDDTGTDYPKGSRKGLENPQIYFIGNLDLSGNKFKYGLNLDLSVTKHKLDTTNFEDHNADTGGTGLTPWVGWEMNDGVGILGARLSYSFLLSDRKITITAAGGDTDATEKQGQLVSLTVFHEFSFNPMWSLGVALSYNTINSTKDTDNTGKETTSDSGHAGFNLAVYAPINVADNITLLPRITYGDSGMLLIGASDVKNFNNMSIGFGARFAF